jgi:hypothetical protein
MWVCKEEAQQTRITFNHADQNYFTDQTELEVMSYVETYQEATRVEIL